MDRAVDAALMEGWDAMSAKLDLRALAATARFASTEPTRYYLNGVCLTIEARSTLYVATDGHRLIALRDELEADEEDNMLLGCFIIPTENAVARKPRKKQSSEARIRGDRKLLTIDHENGAASFKPIDGTFPDWRRVIPNKPCSGEAGQYDHEYLASFKKFSEDMNCGPWVHVAHNGPTDPAIITFKFLDAVGALMPIRGDAVQGRPVPKWALSVKAAA